MEQSNLTVEAYEAAENVLLKQKVDYWDWLRCKGTTPNVYNAIIKAMDEYAASLIKERDDKIQEIINMNARLFEKKQLQLNELFSSNEAKEKECEYWKQRCEAAEDYIHSISYLGSTTPDEKKYYVKWQQLKNQTPNQ